MPEKDASDRISRLFGLGRALRPRWPRTSSRKDPPARRREKIFKLILLLVVSLSIALILTPRPHKPLQRYQVGEVARENLKATADFLVEDVETTAQRQRELLAQIPQVYDLEEQVTAKGQERLHAAMEFMRRAYQEASQPPKAARPGTRGGAAPKASVPTKLMLEQKPEFDRLLGTTIPTSTFQLLVKSEFSSHLEGLIGQVLGQFFRQGVIGSRTMLRPEPREILVRRLPSRQEKVEHPPFPFVDLEEVRKTVAGYCREVAADFTPAERWLVCDLAQYLLVPNVSLNLAETQERRQARLRELRPAYFQVRRGEMLVREGELVTPLILAKLKAQSQIYPQGRGLLTFLGLFVSLTLLLGISYQLARLSLKRLSTRPRDLAFVSALLLAGALLNKGLLVLGDALSRTFPEVGQNLVYALPLGLAPIFAAMFLGLEMGVGVVLLIATFTAFMVAKPLPLFLYFFIAGMVGVWGVRNCRRRSDLIRAGLAISLVNMILLAAFKLLEYPFAVQDLLLGEAFALGGGLVTGILALGLTPVMEAGFQYSSNIRLLELLNFDQPILKELMLVAPGTYHHSLVVGQMVEAASEAIGANPLQAKAAAYYHDIGKIKKPLYFVENQVGSDNKHEKLAPSMSSLILIAHVKEGVDLAHKHKLGETIEDIIQQHHGRSLISFFYHKAKTQGGGAQQVNIEDYRYPGPRPQTKEAGLVLLADQVEAASKTLTDPTPARIQGLVQKIINNVFADGQLDECELTLKDLHLIAKSFIKILSGIHHQRVHYPLPVEKKKSHEDLDKQPPKKNGPKPGEAQEKGREDLKRLGLVEK
jgi:putative nucleotidyltransferase with HDIG domain